MAKKETIPTIIPRHSRSPDRENGCNERSTENLRYLHTGAGMTRSLKQLLLLLTKCCVSHLPKWLLKKQAWVLEDKVIKNHYAAEYIYNAYKNTKTCGVVEEDKAYGIKKIQNL